MKIKECTHTGPDSDGDVNFNAKVTIENKSEHVIELLKTSTLVINPSGICVGGSYDNEHDVFIDPEESESVDVSTYVKGLKKDEVNKTKILVSASLFRRDFHKMGLIDVPEDHKIFSILDKTSDICGGMIKLFGAVLKREKPDEGGNVGLSATVGVRNLSEKSLERIRVKMVLIDQEDAILEETTAELPLPPYMSTVLDPSFWGIKKGRLRNCQVRLGISVFHGIGDLPESSRAAEALSKEGE
jgi:hypothetical protein